MIQVNGRFETIIAIALMLAGIAFAWVGSTYGTGSLRRLGPGFFPLWLGGTLAVFAGLVAIGSILTPRAKIMLEIRGVAWTMIGMLSFAAMLEPLGLIPATITVVTCISVGNGSVNLRRELGTSAGLCLFGYLIFQKLLGIPINLLLGFI